MSLSFRARLRPHPFQHILTSAEAMIRLQQLHHQQRQRQKLYSRRQTFHQRRTKLTKPTHPHRLQPEDGNRFEVDAKDHRIQRSCNNTRWKERLLPHQQPPEGIYQQQEQKQQKQQEQQRQEDGDDEKKKSIYFAPHIVEAERNRSLRVEIPSRSNDGILVPDEPWQLPKKETSIARTPGHCDSTPIKAVIFDRDGTLTDRDAFEALPRSETPVLLRWLKLQGIKIAMVTNTHAFALERSGNPLYFEPLQLDGLFDMVFTFDHFPAKPHSQSVLRCSLIWQIPPENIIVVGDSPDDLDAARFAGMRSFWVYNKFERIKFGKPKADDEHIIDTVRVRYIPTWEGADLKPLFNIIRRCNGFKTFDQHSLQHLLSNVEGEIESIKAIVKNNEGKAVKSVLSIWDRVNKMYASDEGFSVLNTDLSLATWSPCMMRTHPRWASTINKAVGLKKVVLFMEQTCGHRCSMRHIVSDGERYDARECKPYMEVIFRQDRTDAKLQQISPTRQQKQEQKQNKEHARYAAVLASTRYQRWRETVTDFGVNLYVNEDMDDVLRSLHVNPDIHLTGIPPIASHEYHATQVGYATGSSHQQPLPTLFNLNALWCMKAFIERQVPIPFDVLFRYAYIQPVAEEWVSKYVNPLQQEKIVVLVATESAFESACVIWSYLPKTASFSLLVLRTPWQEKNFISKTEQLFLERARPNDSCIVLSSLREVLNVI